MSHNKFSGEGKGRRGMFWKREASATPARRQRHRCPPGVNQQKEETTTARQIGIKGPGKRTKRETDVASNSAATNQNNRFQGNKTQMAPNGVAYHQFWLES